MAVGYGQPCPKPEPRKRVKARTKRQRTTHVKAVRSYVFEREQGTCRICVVRPAESMHEIVPRSLGGRVSRSNSIAVCGDGVRGCHGFAQRHEIHIGGDAEGVLLVSAATAAAKAWSYIDHEVNR